MLAGDVVGGTDVAADLGVGDGAIQDERRAHEHLPALHRKRYRDSAAGHAVDDGEAVGTDQELALQSGASVLDAEADAGGDVLTTSGDLHLH
ncbi:hypothetical protein D3C84_778240 [compost metagenome]